MARTLAAAFASYAWTRWMVPGDDHVDRIRELQSLYLEHVAIPVGGVWVDRDLHGAAVFIPPEVPDLPAEATARIQQVHGSYLARLRAANEALDRLYARGASWTLAALGVLPVPRERGLGLGVISAGLTDLDNRGIDCVLETSDERTIRLYRRLGFEVAAEIVLPENGPRVWVMERVL